MHHLHSWTRVEGVLVAKKDYNAAKHAEIDVPNLQVIKALQSLESRGYVKSQFSWQYYYFFLTEAGIQYLRDYLHLPSEIVPATFKKSARPMTRPGAPRMSMRIFRDRFIIILMVRTRISTWRR